MYDLKRKRSKDTNGNQPSMINCMILNLVHPKQDCSLKSKDLCFGFMSNHVHRYKSIKIFVLDSCRVMSIAAD